MLRKSTRIVSTVYDETREKHHERHAMLFLLHLASWKRNVSDRYPLRVVCITEPKKRIRGAIEEMGAEIVVHPARHFLFGRGPGYNKHLAAPAGGSHDRVFLTDNDTVYLGPVDALFDNRPSAVVVSLAPKARISPEMWEVLIDDFGARPIELQWRPQGFRALAMREGTTCDDERYAYFNSGAIVFPEGADFWKRWEQKSDELSGFLEARSYHGRKSVGTDQASLSLAIAEYGDWMLMPDGFNHFSFHYWLGNIEPKQVRQVHLAGIGRHYGRLDNDEKTSASTLINRFWDQQIVSGMQDLERPDSEVAGALDHRDFILELIRQHELEDLRQFAFADQESNSAAVFKGTAGGGAAKQRDVREDRRAPSAPMRPSPDTLGRLFGRWRASRKG